MRKIKKYGVPALIILVLTAAYAVLVLSTERKDTAFPENLRQATRVVVSNLTCEEIDRHQITRRSQIVKLADAIIAGLGDAVDFETEGTDGGGVIMLDFYHSDRLICTIYYDYVGYRWPLARYRIRIRIGDEQQEFQWYEWSNDDLFFDTWEKVA